LFGLVLNARGFYELARWVAQGLMTTKIQTEGIPGILLGLPAFVPVFRWTIFTPYAFMTSVPILLLLLIIPHFLALPVFWLWVVLSALYVVLTSRAWKRMGSFSTRMGGKSCADQSRGIQVIRDDGTQTARYGRCGQPRATR